MVQTHPCRTAAFLALLAWAVCAASAAAQGSPDEGMRVLIRLDDRRLSVVRVEETSLQLGAGSKGLILWTDADREAWQFIAPGGSWKLRPIGSGEHDPREALHGSRAQNGGSGSEPAVMATALLDQILGQTVVRGSAFLTPHNGRILNPRIAIRRSPLEGKKEFPAAAAVLLKGKQEIATIAFAENQQTLTYEDIPELAKKMPAGLPAGEYYLKMAGSAESALFTIEDAERRREVMERPDRFAERTGSRTNPLYVQIAVEDLLDQRDADDKPVPYLSDALDVLESVPEKALTAHLKQLRRDVADRLLGRKPQAAGRSLEGTGIAVIDQARASIAAGEWKKALAQLDPKQLPDEPRARALAALYRGVVQSESGLGTRNEADASFRQAARQLAGGTPADRFLLHNNAGSHALNQAQDRLYNHAFLMATGGKWPLLAALDSWTSAEAHYTAALQLAQQMSPGQQAAARVNCSRLYVVLADLIRSLDVPVEGKRSFADGEQAAAERAADYARQAGSIANVEPTVLGAAEENQAHLAFRAGQATDCLSHATKALAAYLEAGSLTGAEGIHRLLGLYYLRLGELDPPARADADAAKTALQHFLISNELAEMLRERIPRDRIGASQAGFFARRAYVNEKIIELLVADSKPAEALHYAELASARSLQDLLSAAQAESQAPDEKTRTTAEILADWPKGVAALKYFVGTQKVWLFVIDTKGRVRAHDLLGTKKTSRELVADVGTYIRGMNSQVARFIEHFQSGKGFDHGWQDPLHDFYQTLIPDGVLEQLRAADTVVVAPHHILHYFPFAALVTQRDTRKRGPEEMVEPRFLVDERFHLVHVPSLAVWDALRQRADTPLRDASAMGIVDFANPRDKLPGVATDLKDFKDAFGERVGKVLFNKEADKGSVQKLLARPGMVFFGTHGSNKPDRPLETHLVVHGAGADDKLTARDVFASRVRSDLIVMSACQTGLADRSPLPGDDLFGLQRAFLQSGARTVVSGLWNVPDDSGPELMNGLFQRLVKGEAAAAALAGSQRAFLEKQRAPGANSPQLIPFYWAVYTVAGDPRTRFGK